MVLTKEMVPHYCFIIKLYPNNSASDRFFPRYCKHISMLLDSGGYLLFGVQDYLFKNS